MFGYEPLAEGWRADTAALLAARLQREQAAQPLLPPRLAEPATAAAALDALLQRRTSGTVAVADGALRGYLIGAPGESALLGRTLWFTPESYALAEDVTTEVLRDLYAVQAAPWVEQGYFSHYVMVAASSPLLNVWLRLGFAYQQSYALLPLAQPAEPAPPPGVELRLARADDAPALVAMAHFTAGYQTRAPVFAPAPPEHVAALRAGYAQLAGEGDAAATWIALREGELLAVQAYYAVPAAANNLLSDDRWVELAAATTHPAWRGQGIGRALTCQGLTWAEAAGYTTCLTDWRCANLAASRVWPRFGFEPVYYRLERRIDSRIAWARVAEE